MAVRTQSGWRKEHRSHLVAALTGVYGTAGVFGFGLAVGRLTEPVPGMPGGIHALAWLILPLLVGTVVVPLVSVSHAAYRVPRSPVGSERLALVQPGSPQWVPHADAAAHADVCNLDSALGQFPPEPVSSAGALSKADAEVGRVA